MELYAKQCSLKEYRSNPLHHGHPAVNFVRTVIVESFTDHRNMTTHEALTVNLLADAARKAINNRVLTD